MGLAEYIFENVVILDKLPDLSRVDGHRQIQLSVLAPLGREINHHRFALGDGRLEGLFAKRNPFEFVLGRLHQVERAYRAGDSHQAADAPSLHSSLDTLPGWNAANDPASKPDEDQSR